MSKKDNVIYFFRNLKEKKHLIVLTVIILFLLTSFDLEKILNQYSSYIILKNNLAFIIDSVIKILPIIGILLTIFIFVMFRKKWVFRIEKLSIGGASIEFDRPESFFRQNIKNFLNTKRTLFQFDAERDNIYNTIESFYNVYNFIREQLKIYDPKSSENSKYYKTANYMIYTMNEFLTSYQDNYRRWFEHESKKEENHDIDICDLQKRYRHYSCIIKDITDLNQEFQEYAIDFDINTSLWIKSKFKSTE